MSYKVRFTDFSKSLTVEDQMLNTETSVALVGKQYLNYAPVISENFLHLLENFAFAQAPLNPVKGQLWYDTSIGTNQLKIYNGIRWTEIGFIKKSKVIPGDPVIGDLWIDTTNNQLKMYVNGLDSANEWITIGPSLGSTDTGLAIETIIDNEPVLEDEDINIHKHIVISLYVNTVRIAIISNESFIPQFTIPGFAVINAGVNLNDVSFSFYGTASQANALVVDNTIVESSKFLRTYITNTLSETLNVQKNSGVSIGDELLFNLGIDSNNNIFISSLTKNKNINIGYSVDLLYPVISVQVNDGVGTVGIGENNMSPTRPLDVFGDARIRGNLLVESISTNGKISSNLILPEISESLIQNAQGKNIGYTENSSGFLTGVWVGISTVYAENLVLENIIMVVDESNQVGITGWTANKNTGLVKFNTPNNESEVYSLPLTGQLTRIRPFIYFYSEFSELAYRSGCSLQSIIVNKSGDIATIGFLTKKDCTEDVSFDLKTAMLYKMSDNIDDFSTIYTDISLINDQWIQ